jgi:hypothetical protein
VVEGVIETLREEFSADVEAVAESGGPWPDPPETPPEGFSKGSGGVREGSANPSRTHNARVSPSTSTTPSTSCSDPSGRAAAAPPPAAPPPEPDALPADFPKPKVVPESEGQRVNRLTKAYTDQVPLAKFPAVSGIIRKAVRAEKDGKPCYDDRLILEALDRLVVENRNLTEGTLRYELDGFAGGRSAADRPVPGQSMWDKEVPHSA